MYIYTNVSGNFKYVLLLGDPGYPGPSGQTGLRGDRGQKGTLIVALSDVIVSMLV